jgi:Fe-S cluster assembly ATP-binding protein
MAELQVTQLKVEADGRTVVDGASFVLKQGEVHVLMGPNGSGKSSLLNALLGHPKYAVTGGSAALDGEDITMLPTEKKAQKGIFLSLQHLPEIPGVTLTNFLHKAYKATTREISKGSLLGNSQKLPLDISPLDFYKHMESRAKEFDIDPSFLKKHLNAGLSGGEKKLSEVLQLVALEPKFALLDEIDSGVDVDSLKKVFAVITALKAKRTGFLLVSHHPNLLSHILPERVYVMRAGKIVASGGQELAEKIASEGFHVI